MFSNLEGLQNPPYGAKVDFIAEEPDAGWSSPILSSWLETGVHEVSVARSLWHHQDRPADACTPQW